jgi:excisionase family DNA binding protein
MLLTISIADKNIMSDNNTNSSSLLLVSDLAKILKMSKTAVYRIISSRKIPFYKIGHNIRFAEKDVLKYLEDNRVKSITDR